MSEVLTPTASEDGGEQQRFVLFLALPFRLAQRQRDEAAGAGVDIRGRRIPQADPRHQSGSVTDAKPAYCARVKHGAP